MKHNAFILKCFLQLTCTNLGDSQKEGGNFLNLLQKEGGSLRKGGGVPMLEETMFFLQIPKSQPGYVSYMFLNYFAF